MSRLTITETTVRKEGSCNLCIQRNDDAVVYRIRGTSLDRTLVLTLCKECYAELVKYFEMLGIAAQ